MTSDAQSWPLVLIIRSQPTRIGVLRVAFRRAALSWLRLRLARPALSLRSL